jgi:hypothetical protein
LAPAPDAPASSPLSPFDPIERVDLWIALGQQAFELRVRRFQAAQPLDVCGFKRPEMTPPVVDRLFADPVLLRDFGDRRLTASRRIMTICSSVKRTFSWGSLMSREPFSEVPAGPKNLRGSACFALSTTCL